MMYETIVEFKDIKDEGYRYRVGESYPRTGFYVSPERLNELSTPNNRRHIAVIREVAVREPETGKNAAGKPVDECSLTEDEKPRKRRKNIKK